MKIYLSPKQPEPGYLHVTHIHQLQELVLDKEASSIIVDNFLTSFKLDEIESLLKIILNKMRLGCDLIILEKDIDMICLKYYRGELDIKELNDTIFETNTKSLINFELLESKINETLDIQEKFIEPNGNFVLKARRTK